MGCLSARAALMTWPLGTVRRRSRTGSPSPAGRTIICGYWWRRSYRAEKELPGPPAWRGIAGYSLAGLFALYAIYRTDVFSRVGCMSGSLWFPGFKEYVFSHEPKRRPDCIYFSLGDKEVKTRNPVLKTVQENTEEIQAFYQNKGIDTVFHLNPGNHFVQGIERTIACIQRLLSK